MAVGTDDCRYCVILLSVASAYVSVVKHRYEWVRLVSQN